MHLYQTLQLFWQLDLFISMAIFPFALFFGEFLVPVLRRSFWAPCAGLL